MHIGLILWLCIHAANAADALMCDGEPHRYPVHFGATAICIAGEIALLAWAGVFRELKF